MKESRIAIATLGAALVGSILAFIERGCLAYGGEVLLLLPIPIMIMNAGWNWLCKTVNKEKKQHRKYRCVKRYCVQKARTKRRAHA